MASGLKPIFKTGSSALHFHVPLVPLSGCQYNILCLWFAENARQRSWTGVVRANTGSRLAVQPCRTARLLVDNSFGIRIRIRIRIRIGIRIRSGCAS